VSWWVWLLVAVGLVVLAVIAMSLRDVNRYRRIRRMWRPPAGTSPP